MSDSQGQEGPSNEPGFQPLQKLQDFWMSAAKQAGCMHSHLSSRLDSARQHLLQQHKFLVERQSHFVR